MIFFTWSREEQEQAPFFATGESFSSSIAFFTFAGEAPSSFAMFAAVICSSAMSLSFAPEIPARKTSASALRAPATLKAP